MALADVPPGRGRADGRVPPYNLEAEESLLGAMLLSRDAIVAAAEIGVSADDFYKPAHAHVFDAITSLYGAGEPADPVTVAEELRRAGLLADVGGPGLLVSLQVRTPATSSAARYARIVSEHALLRRLIAVAGEIAEMGYRVPDDVAEAVDRAEALVFDVAQHRVSDTLAPIRDLLDHSLTRLEALYEKGDTITGVPTGYQGLDELLAGLQPSSLVIVGARPATGKCLTGDTLLTDPRSGARTTLAEVYRRGRRGEEVQVTSLGNDRRLSVRRPSAFIDDGVRPVFRVRTRLGREVCTTAAHPFLTANGWRPLADIAVGTPIAVPRELPLFGDRSLPEAEVVILAHLLGDSASTAASVRVTTDSAAVTADLERHGAAFGAQLRPERRAESPPTWRLVTPPHQPDLLGKMLHEHGLVGVRAHARAVPEAVFRLPRRQLALFLGRLLGPEASAWWSTREGGSACISYCSVSRRLVADLAHLLLRFGINPRLRRRVIQRQGWRGPAYELELTTIDDIRRLAAHIGLFSKEAALANLLTRMERRTSTAGQSPGPTGEGLPDTPLVPVVAVRRAPLAGRAAGSAGAGAAVGSMLDERPSPSAACPALRWDEIVAIDSAGEERVYDLTVPGDHNFVAADIFVHNTAFALGMAAHAALEANRPTLFFSLEMSHLEITQRLLAAEARVDSSKLRNGKLAESDWTKISHAIGRLAEAPLYIDDNPRATVLEIRAKSRRLKSRLGDLGMVVVDYLQLMTGRTSAENRQVEVSEISRGLKVLARELQTPVVALSQLSRNLELRADKRPMLADLRESGCLTADARVLRCDTGVEVTMGELVRTGERDIPVWTLDRDLCLVPGTMSSVFPTGVKQVYELRLASGRRVKASANHPFLTRGGWLRLDELALGTGVAVPRRLGAPQMAAPWAEHEVAMVAQLVGQLHDGPGHPAHRRCVPAAVFALPDHQLVGFVRELWPAGTALDGRRAGPCFSSSSRRVLDDLQLVLLRLDVESRVRAGGGGGGDGGGLAHLVVEGDQSRARLGELLAGGDAAFTWPNPALRTLVGAGAGPRRALPSRDRLARVASVLEDPELDRRARADVRWDPVVAIEPRGQEAVFDATVPESHNFVANGIVVENSLEQDADVVMFLYRDELYNPESPDRGTAEVLVAKHRSGPTGMDRLAFLDHYTRFANMARGI